MTLRLTEIFDCRLQSLIGYSSSRFTREIIEFMFRHFKYIGMHTINYGYDNLPMQHLSDILSFTPGTSGHEGDAAGLSAIQFTMSLENFIRTTVNMLFPDWQNQYNDDEWRKVLGMEFRKKVQQQPSLYPASLTHDDFISQLNYTTLYRNRLAHKQVIGNTGMYKRYYILQSYDVILSYLLYTFYYMTLKEDYEFKYIND